jgi:hypothetical protein
MVSVDESTFLVHHGAMTRRPSNIEKHNIAKPWLALNTIKALSKVVKQKL